MRSLMFALCTVALATSAHAGSYRVLLQPIEGKMIVGHAGVEAVDRTTATAHVRLITPGNEVKQRGTVRVLVRNLSTTAFTFGPDDVKLQLDDGTELAPTPLDKFERGAEIVQRDMNQSAAIRVQTDNSLGSYAQQGGGGQVQSFAPVPGADIGTQDAMDVQDTAQADDEADLPEGQLMDALYQVLLPETVGPKQVWGGYYVFDVPKKVLARRADQPLTIVVTTGAERHRFAATLHWK